MGHDASDRGRGKVRRAQAHELANGYDQAEQRDRPRSSVPTVQEAIALNDLDEGEVRYPAVPVDRYCEHLRVAKG